MELDETCTRRDYLYGRLLAVAEVAESVALNKKEGKRCQNYQCSSVFYSICESAISDLECHSAAVRVLILLRCQKHSEIITAQ